MMNSFYSVSSVAINNIIIIMRNYARRRQMKKLLTKFKTTVIGKVLQLVAMGIGTIGYFILFLLITQKLDWVPNALLKFWEQEQNPIVCFICMLISLVLWFLYQMIIVIIFIIPLAFIKEWIERNDEKRNDEHK